MYPQCQPRRLWGQTVFLSAKRLASNAWLIIVSDAYSRHAVEQYAQRWSIETLFAALKSHGSLPRSPSSSIA